MRSLYCPECGNYLEGGDGNIHDCSCGWRQPCERSTPTEIFQCQFCESTVGDLSEPCAFDEDGDVYVAHCFECDSCYDQGLPYETYFKC